MHDGLASLCIKLEAVSSLQLLSAAKKDFIMRSFTRQGTGYMAVSDFGLGFPAQFGVD